MTDIHRPADPQPDWDTADRISIGWIGVTIGFTRWYWVTADEARKITGASKRDLRYWSDHALISYMSDGAGCHRRYMRPELDAVQRIALGRPITTRLLRRIIAVGFPH